MKPEDSPYNSTTFLNKWKHHFDAYDRQVKFPALVGPRFIKNGPFSSYKNTTANLTLQNQYKYVPKHHKDFYNKLVIIYDVPDYLQDSDNTLTGRIKKIVVKEYSGYLIDLKASNNLEFYLKNRFNSKNRSQFRSYIRKLENSFSVSYRMFYGHIIKKEYDFLIQEFYNLSLKSFEFRKIKNRKLLPKNFNFLKDVVFELILEKKACLFVVYDGDKPIGICVNFITKEILFGDSTVYDLNYSKFNIGIIMLIKQIEWCIENKINFYDFSKGHFPYKEKWCNSIYSFEHHIIYDSNILTLCLKAHLIKSLLDFKQYLREHPLRNYLKQTIFISKRKNIDNYQFIENPTEDLKNSNKVLLSDYSEITKPINDFLYSNIDKKADLKIFKLTDMKDTFHIKGKDNSKWFYI